ncbi:pseudouridine synthase [Sphingomonas baiyangensis]|uniref:pseudouridine synthase n=1 Tax=Sphingomonas baiyangensis TaxID=2572576 RepID=UPI002938D30B|nr:pseudouridine synthase [Sphingomonas baiyangensis]
MHRIAKLLARAGIASRREIERMIAEGRVAIDGTPLATPATLIASLRGVTVDGQPVAAPAPARLFRFHKPAGVLTTERDPAGRRTIYDILPRDLPRVMPVGRLDLNTEGLLLLTTDGELKRQLELPATQVKRSYRARAFGEVSQAQLEELIEGIEIDGIRYGSIDANLERRTGANTWIEMTLTEGKNREVRRVLEHLGLQVSRLIRTSYGPIPLADMPVGAIDEIRQHDLILLRRDLKLAPDRRSDSAVGTHALLARAAVEPDAPRRLGAAGQTRATARADATPAKARVGRIERSGGDARPDRSGRSASGARRPEHDLRRGERGERSASREDRPAQPHRERGSGAGDGRRERGPRAERATAAQRPQRGKPTPSRGSFAREERPAPAERGSARGGGEREASRRAPAPKSDARRPHGTAKPAAGRNDRPRLPGDGAPRPPRPGGKPAGKR